MLTGKQKRGIFIVLLLVLVFFIADHFLILTKLAALQYGRQLLEETYSKPRGAVWTLPLDAEKKDGVWKVYDTFELPKGFIGSRFFVTFGHRGQMIDIGME